MRCANPVATSEMRKSSEKDRADFANSLVGPACVYDIVATALPTGHLKIHMLRDEDIDAAEIDRVTLR